MKPRAEAVGIEPLAPEAQPSAVDGAQPRAGERLPRRGAVQQ